MGRGGRSRVSLDWVFSESGSNSAIGYLRTSLGGADSSESGAVTGKEVAVTCFSQKRGGYLVFCGFHSNLILSHFVTGSEQPCLMWMFYETVCPTREQCDLAVSVRSVCNNTDV